MSIALAKLLKSGYRWVRTDGAWAVFERGIDVPYVDSDIVRERLTGLPDISVPEE